MSDAPKPTINDLKEEVLRRLNFQNFYERHVNASLKRENSDGWSNRVLCPIHGDQSTPNFFVNLNTGRFKCHACGEGGSVFDFWLNRNGFSVQDKAKYKDAVLALATEAGLDIKQWASNYTPPVGAARKSKAPEDREEDEVIPKRNTTDAHDATAEPIARELVEEFQKALQRQHIKYLVEKRGLKKRTIDNACIGWDNSVTIKVAATGKWTSGRYTLPVFDRNGVCRNIRKYSELVSPDFKMVNHTIGKDEKKVGYGKPPRLYCLDRLVAENWQHVIVCEGEWDCLLLNQILQDFGLTTWGAVTGTHGVKTFLPEWLQFLEGRYVYICFDCDDKGKTASKEVATKYLLRALKANRIKGAKIIDLPLDGSKEMKDIGDYFLKAEFKAEDFVKLVDGTPELIAGGLSADDATVEAIEVSDFVTAVKDRRYIDKRIRVPITISGTTSKVYHAIREFKVTKCPLMGNPETPCCSEGSPTSVIPYGHPLFIESCMQRQDQILRSIAAMTCQKDRDCKVKPISKVVMEEYFAHQVVERWRAEENADGQMQNSQELVQASVYILQPPNNIPIEPTNYMATGFVRTHPKTSVATLFIESMVQMEEDWKKFTLETGDNRAALKTLKEEFSIDEIVNDITQGVTQIYDSDDILYTVLLSFLSPLWINFNGRLIRGWVNTAILGDSGTGKSATYMRLSDWIELGDLFSVLSGTRTGLLYAVKQKNGEWHVSIGRYVQSSGKIIAIDETDKADKEELRKMAVAMQEGWLEVAQVASGGYHTQTRTIFMLNPQRNGQAATISDFTYGCDALREVFDPMFIRRLDLAVFTMGRKKYEFYNQRAIQRPTIRLTAKMLRSLVYWAWTRKPDQVVWSVESTDTCLQLATSMSAIYGDADQVPLVNPNDFREKLARLSVAYAILDRNFSEDMEKVLIEPKHVQAIATLLEAIYSSTACNLSNRSKQAKVRNTLDDFDRIKSAFEMAVRASASSVRSKNNHFVQLLVLLQQIGTVRKRDLSEQLGVSIPWLQRRVGLLQSFNLLELTRYGFRTTRKFNLFMHKWTEDSAVQSMVENAYGSISDPKEEDFKDDFEPRAGSWQHGNNEPPPEVQYADNPFN